MKPQLTDNQKRIIAIIIIILILIGGGIIGNFIDNLLKTASYKNNSSENNILSQFKTIIQMPFFYVTQYPQTIQGIADDNVQTSEPSKSQTAPKRKGKYKKFIKYQ